MAAHGGVAQGGETPNTARLRYLELNPELAFGGTTKLAPSPPQKQQAMPRKLNAREQHAREWASVDAAPW